jgi:hypothetical protein
MEPRRRLLDRSKRAALGPCGGEIDGDETAIPDQNTVAAEERIDSRAVIAVPVEMRRV